MFKIFKYFVLISFIALFSFLLFNAANAAETDGVGYQPTGGGFWDSTYIPQSDDIHLIGTDFTGDWSIIYQPNPVYKYYIRHFSISSDAIDGGLGISCTYPSGTHYYTTDTAFVGTMLQTAGAGGHSSYWNQICEGNILVYLGSGGAYDIWISPIASTTTNLNKINHLEFSLVLFLFILLFLSIATTGTFVIKWFKNLWRF